MKKLLLLGAMAAMLIPTGAYARDDLSSYGLASATTAADGTDLDSAPITDTVMRRMATDTDPMATHGPNTGQVKLDTKVKDAQVFVNGNYSGTTKELKSMNLKPGDYNLEIRVEGREAFRQDIHVIAGKTMTLHPDLTNIPPAQPAASE